MAYTDGNVDYNEEDVENAPMWNAGSVYFDDEIVEYQSRYYIALCKTSAQVPGRSKHGIWKELVYEEDEIPFDDEMNDAQEEASAAQLSNVAPKNKPETKKDSTTEKVPATKERDVPSTAKLKKTIKPVNKTLEKKKTLKERQDEQAEKKKATAKSETSMIQTTERKMTIAPSDQSIVNEVLKEIEFKKIKGLNSDDSNITSNLILAQKGKDDIKLTWKSSHPDIISEQGKVNPPEDGHDVAVNLSLTVSKGKASATRFFTLWVKGKEKSYSDEEAVELVYDMLDFSQFRGNNVKADAITEDVELLTDGLYDTKIFWASSQRNLLDETGKLYKKSLSADANVRLYAIITKGQIEKFKHFDLTLKCN